MAIGTEIMGHNDHRHDLGQFILTGSAVPVGADEIHHSGTGRFAWITIRPMSLYESGESTGDISIARLFESPDQILGINKLTLDDLAFLICRGGWPRASLMEGDIALDQAKDYNDAVTKSDVSRVDGVRRNAERVKRLMRSYARHQGAQATVTTIMKDMPTNDTGASDLKTVNSYIEALKKIFVIEDSLQYYCAVEMSCDIIITRNGKDFKESCIPVLTPDEYLNSLKTKRQK